MDHASLFLERFKRFGFKDQILKQTIIDVLKDDFDIDIKKEEISLIEGNVKINVSGPIKSEIFINKDKIQQKVIEKLNDPKNFVHKIS